MISKTNTNKCVLAAAMLVKKWQERGTDKANIEFGGDSPHVREFGGFRGSEKTVYDILWTIAEDGEGRVWASTALEMIRIDTLIDPLGDVDIIQEVGR